MTPERTPARVLTNLSPREQLGHLLDVLTGELQGPGGQHVSEAREHARRALAAPTRPERIEHLTRAEAALTLAAQERPAPSTKPRPMLTVERVTPTPAGARLDVLHAPPVTLERREVLHLQLDRPYGWAWLSARAGTPEAQSYALSPFLVRDAAAALGFDLEHLDELHTPHTVEAQP